MSRRRPPPRASRELFRVRILLLFNTALIASSAPFVLIRLLEEQPAAAAVDAGLILIALALSQYVRQTKRIGSVGTFLMVLYTGAVVVLALLRHEAIALWLFPTTVANLLILPHRWAIAVNIAALVAVVPLYGRVEALTYLTFLGSLVLANLLAGIVARVTESRRRRLERARAVLRESEIMRSHAESLARMGSWQWDSVTDDFRPSPEWRQVTGVTEERLTRETAVAHVHPEDAAEVRASLERAVSTGTPHDIENRIVRPDNGEVRWVRVHAEGSYRDGELVKVYGFIQDVTDRRRVEDSLRQKSYHLGERVKELACINRISGILGHRGCSLSDSLEEIAETLPPAFQYPAVTAARVAVEGREHATAGFRDDAPCLDAATVADGRTVGRVTVCYREPRPVADEGPFIAEERSLVDLIARRLGEVVERERAQRELQRLVYEDPLTGLPSRAGFVRRLQQALDGSPERLHLLVVDLQRLNDVNQAHGFRIGDKLLKAVGERLAADLGKDECLARLGEGHFGALRRVPESRGDRTEAAAAAWVERRLTAPLSVEGRPIKVDATIGIARLGGDCRTPEEALRRAQLARHAARESDDRSWVAFTPELDREAKERIRITEGLRVALDCRQFELRYQPVVRLADGRPVAVEALLRWRHPSLGWQMPDRFIPIAERSQLIVPIGEWALRAACRALADWGGADIADGVRVAVNVSVIQFAQSDLPATVRAALDETGLPARCLSLEITESVLEKQPLTLLTQIRRLREMGVRIALDDFGIGYSSLAHLHDYPFDQIKIDRRFVQSCVERAYSREIVRMVLRVAETLGAEVVAEGVETPQQAAVLRELGCPLGQGFYFGAGVSAEAAAAIWESRLPAPDGVP